ncbi:MAG TPA: hypothetical protein VMH89_01350, partial [Candidatus Acidoferrum sp.]|nr:hypothetical protein [Candidatus Acidoferrum sp.]
YRSVEDELKARKVPGLRISRVEYHEGGLLSDKRTYLRLARERFAFDVCAAPFGRAYFFSLRFVEVPRLLLPRILALIAIVILALFVVRQTNSLASILWVFGISLFAVFLVLLARATKGQTPSIVSWRRRLPRCLRSDCRSRRVMIFDDYLTSNFAIPGSASTHVANPVAS